MNLLELFSEFNYLFEIVYGISVFIFSFFVRDLGKLIKQHKLKWLLNLSKNDTQLCLPIRNGRLNDQRRTRLTTDYVTYDEALVLYEVHKLIDELGSSSFQEPRQTQEFCSKNNLICVGGPMVNDQVRKLFRTNLSRVKHKWLSVHDVKRTEIYREFIYTDDTNASDGLMVGEHEILFQAGIEGYILLARLVGKQCKSSENDFADSEHGTVHVMYGANAKCTLAAVKSMTTHRDELYRRLKHRKGHYLAIIMCDADGELDFRTFLDLTDDAFPANTIAKEHSL